MIEKIEISMINGAVHNFKKGEFGVENIEINEMRGVIEINYGYKEGGIKHVILPVQNVEKCEYIEKKS
ncbi:hypothetical protein [Methanobacterium paludis]|uniref:Uncharacterized protein n=1 Tax=Methanobacterium paludis (strain DSM 25820 / JCM 18151 / SWAN1) TaxID=868131 RepID=F6D1U7_METPW|nr:hypothetical protein [Methanobacterium paludis]AEG18574.1 hypothetical protein MSWAN_1560 [Methanobacterium paludis]